MTEDRYRELLNAGMTPLAAHSVASEEASTAILVEAASHSGGAILSGTTQAIPLFIGPVDPVTNPALASKVVQGSYWVDTSGGMPSPTVIRNGAAWVPQAIVGPPKHGVGGAVIILSNPADLGGGAAVGGSLQIMAGGSGSDTGDIGGSVSIYGGSGPGSVMPASIDIGGGSANNPGKLQLTSGGDLGPSGSLAMSTGAGRLHWTRGGASESNLIVLDDLPVVDPEVAGALYVAAGFLKVSAGPA